MIEDSYNSTTTKLLTLLNVSAARVGKRKHLLDDIHTPVKLNKRKSSAATEDNKEKEIISPQGANEIAKDFDIDDVKVDEDGSYANIICLSTVHLIILFWPSNA